MTKGFFRTASDVLAKLPGWQPPPTVKQKRESKRLRTWLYICITLYVFGVIDHFFLGLLPEWVVYALVLGCGIAAWPLAIRARMALNSVDHDQSG